MKYDACVDCGIEKTGRQQVSPRCMSCSTALKNARRTTSSETKKKQSKALSGVPKSLETRKKMSISKGGDGDIMNRRYPGLSSWIASVKKTFACCVVCRSTEDLEAHHIVPKAKYPEFATFPLNGVTLCKPCHRSVHAPL